MSTSRRKGLRRFAWGLLFTGIILILSGLLLRPAFERLSAWGTDGLGAEASLTLNVVDPLFREINTTFSRYSLIFGTGYLIPALATYGILLVTRTKESEVEVGVNDSGPHTNGHLEKRAPITAQVADPATTPEASVPVTSSEQTPIIEPLRPVTSELQIRRENTRKPPRIQG
jgi:hypothetical protein